MFTINYKGFFINGHTNSDTYSVVWPHGGLVMPGYQWKTMLGAKRFITRILEHQPLTS